jgi:hypothetical protein
MQPSAAPVEYIPSYRLQTVARKIHHLPLLLLLEIRPHTDPMGSHRDNLQKWVFLFYVKDKVISCIPNCPNNHANIHSNLNKILLRNALEPISKKVSSGLRRFQAKCHMNDTPNYFARGHSKNKCCVDSLLSQKQHESLLFQFLFIKLSLVRITFRWRNHINLDL